MKFSVVVPVYNTEKYLNRCLDSILSYRGDDLEVIALDDGSTDGSPAILQSYRDARLNVVHKQNEGVFKTWKKGVMLASGDYIVFADSDDYVSEELFPVLKGILAERDYDVVQLGWTEKYIKKEVRMTGAPGLKEGSYEGEALEEIIRERVKMSKDKIISTTRWAKAYRTDFLREVLTHSMEQITMFEDDSITRPCLSLMKSFYYSETPLYVHFCCVGGSICNSVEKYAAYFADCKNLVAFFEEKRDIFGFSQETLDLFAAHYFLSIIGEAVSKKENRVAKRMLSDESVKGALKKKKGLKCFLLRHRRFTLFRILKRTKDFIINRY